MAKHPVPKHRSSSTRSSRRYNTFQKSALKKLNGISATVICKACGAPRRPHAVCLSCGVYRGRQVLAASATPQVEKVKA